MNKKSKYILESSSILLSIIAALFLYSDVILQWIAGKDASYNPVGDFVNIHCDYSYNIMFGILALYLVIQMFGCVFSPVKTGRFLSDALFSLIPFGVSFFIYFFRLFDGHDWGAGFFNYTAYWIMAVTFFDVFIGLAIRAKIWSILHETQTR